MVLRKQITQLILLTFTAFSLATCVSEYPLEDDITPAEFIIVDGIINHNLKGDSSNYVVQLSETKLLGNNSAYQIALTGATMSIIVNDKEVLPMVEREKGSYYLNRTDVFKVGNTFKLQFQKGENKYESSGETLPDTVGIQKIYSELAEKPTAGNAYEIFVDVQDNPKVRNYYKWSVKQWEKQQYCQFCYRSGRSELCNQDLYASIGAEISKNNFCSENCYDILIYNPNNSISDIFFDGRTLLKKSLVVTPYNFSTGTLIEVNQSSITPQYFAFLDLLKSQSLNTGGLADTPAAILIGNVKNLNNSSQKVLGYFSVTNTVSQRLWIDRKDAIDKNLKALANANPPLPQPVPGGWPVVACKESKTRTSKKPSGWVN
jgi:Domain of unknown function (DUF4249)